jgi:voltage-gated potassium channel
VEKAPSDGCAGGSGGAEAGGPPAGPSGYDAPAMKTPAVKSLRQRLHEIIFESDTRAGRLFDATLLWTIVLSVAAVMLESVGSVRARWGQELRILEWIFTGLFTVEYLLRVVVLRRPSGYVFSFFGLVDLLSFVPTYLSAVLPGVQALIAVRAFRVIRLFRIFKLVSHMRQARVIGTALRLSRPKIAVFLLGVLAIVVTMGSVIYLVEGEESGFTSIPRSVYWAVVTVTTVGYGDMVPRTVLGQVIASMAMILGYAIIAVPTGIVTVDLAEASRQVSSGQACPSCGAEGHDHDAAHCKRCGSKL